MNAWARFIFIFIAYGIALLHTVVPHHHASSRNGEPIISHAGCHYAHSGGLLQRVLSTDLGMGHLETFKKGSDTRIHETSRLVAVFILFIPDVTVALPLRSVTEALRGYVGKLKQHHLLFSVTHFRAPPAFF